MCADNSLHNGGLTACVTVNDNTHVRTVSLHKHVCDLQRCEVERQWSISPVRLGVTANVSLNTTKLDPHCSGNPDAIQQLFIAASCSEFPSTNLVIGLFSNI